jgi:hypothetical protein
MKQGRLIMKRIAALAAVTLLAGLTSPLTAVAKPVVEVAFVLDTTGSMGPLIEGAKKKIWSIATSILECSPDAEIRIGLVAYRDIGDDYVTKLFPLTTDIQDLYANLLELRARGGGDWPESVNEALDVAVDKMAWSARPGATRIMFLVGDAPPRMDYAQDTKYPAVLAKARHHGIVVNAVQAGAARDTERVWREIAQMGNGEYIPIPQDGGRFVVIETPYDIEIIELQKRINRTVLPYGSPGNQRRVEQKTAQIAAAPKATSADMAGYLSRRAQSAGGAEAVTGDGDLVADIAAGRQRLDGIKDDELPESLRKLEPPQRQAYLDGQLTQRRALNDQLAELIKKRDGFVAGERKKNPTQSMDSFDRAVENTLRGQIRN